MAAASSTSSERPPSPPPPIVPVGRAGPRRGLRRAAAAGASAPSKATFSSSSSSSSTSSLHLSSSSFRRLRILVAAAAAGGGCCCCFFFFFAAAWGFRRGMMGGSDMGVVVAKGAATATTATTTTGANNGKPKARSSSPATNATATNDTAAAATARTRSPRRVYCCGWRMCLADAIFPEVASATYYLDGDEATLMRTAAATDPFGPDDVLVYNCGGPCPITQAAIYGAFPGPILTLNGESDPAACRIGDPKKNKRKRPTTRRKSVIISLDRIGGGHPDDDESNDDESNERPGWREASTYYAGLVLAAQPRELRRALLDRGGGGGGGGGGGASSHSASTSSSEEVQDGQMFLIYANSHCVPYREQAYRSLAAIGDVHYGGECSGRYAGSQHWWSQWLPRAAPVGRPSDDVRASLAGWGGNRQLFRRYRFVLCMENANIPGYITEKILVAFLASSVPVYYGTPEIFDVFNRDAFVYYDIRSPRAALDRVAYLERNRTAYREVLKAPVFARGRETYDQYFSLWDDDDIDDPSDDNGTNKSGSTSGGRLKWAIRERIGFGRGPD